MVLYRITIILIVFVVEICHAYTRCRYTCTTKVPIFDYYPDMYAYNLQVVITQNYIIIGLSYQLSMYHF